MSNTKVQGCVPGEVHSVLHEHASDAQYNSFVPHTLRGFEHSQESINKFLNA